MKNSRKKKQNGISIVIFFGLKELLQEIGIKKNN